MVLAAVAAFATVASFVMPLLTGDRLGARMKYVSSERERLRAERIANLAEEQRQARLRREPKSFNEAGRRAAQSAQGARDRRDTRTAEDGRLPGTGPGCRLPVLPRNAADYRLPRRVRLSLLPKRLRPRDHRAARPMPTSVFSAGTLPEGDRRRISALLSGWRKRTRSSVKGTPQCFSASQGRRLHDE